MGDVHGVYETCVWLLCQESYTYRDPITQFLECLYVNFDFDDAQQKLRECETVCCDLITTSGFRLTSLLFQSYFVLNFWELLEQNFLSLHCL